jgi:UDP-N-acetylglucosamine 1-carboxyvinyltransferase
MPPPSRTSSSSVSSSRRWASGVTGTGSSTIRVDGVPRLHRAQHRLGGDYIEAGSWAVIAAITGGRWRSTALATKTSKVVGSVLKRMHVACGMDARHVRGETVEAEGGARITTGCGQASRATW